MRDKKKKLIKSKKTTAKRGIKFELNLTDKEIDEIEKGMIEFRDSFKFDF